MRMNRVRMMNRWSFTIYAAWCRWSPKVAVTSAGEDVVGRMDGKTHIILAMWYFPNDCLCVVFFESLPTQNLKSHDHNESFMGTNASSELIDYISWLNLPSLSLSSTVWGKKKKYLNFLCSEDLNFVIYFLTVKSQNSTDDGWVDFAFLCSFAVRHTKHHHNSEICHNKSASQWN